MVFFAALVGLYLIYSGVRNKNPLTAGLGALLWMFTMMTWYPV